MAYTAITPQPNDKIKDSQPVLLANFQEIETFVTVNHAPFNTVNQGKHEFAQFPAQSINPDTNQEEMALFCREMQNPSVAGTYTLALKQNQTQDPNGELIPGSIVEFTSIFPGWARLPSGMLMKWMTVPIPSRGIGTFSATFGVTWATSSTIPVFNGSPMVAFTTPITLASSNIGASTVIIASSVFGEDPALRINIGVVSTSTFGGWNAFNMYVIALGIG